MARHKPIVVLIIFGQRLSFFSVNKPDDVIKSLSIDWLFVRVVTLMPCLTLSNENELHSVPVPVSRGNPTTRTVVLLPWRANLYCCNVSVKGQDFGCCMTRQDRWACSARGAWRMIEICPASTRQRWKSGKVSTPQNQTHDPPTLALLFRNLNSSPTNS